MDSQTSRNVRRISKTNYLGNGLSVYLITHDNGGLFFISFLMNAIILSRKFDVRTALRKI